MMTEGHSSPEAQPSLWTPRRVFITGVRGFIGHALADRYTQLGCEVRGLGRTADPSHSVIGGDIRFPGEWQTQMEGCDLVIHTAAMVSLTSDPRSFWATNVLGTKHVLDAAKRAGATRFVHLSSVTVFSFDFPDGVDEQYPVHGNGTPYVDTKVAGEQVVLEAHAAGEIACTIVRPGDVYGPRSRAWTILPVQMLRAGRFFLPSSGKGVFSPIYIDNLVDGILLAAGTPQAADHIFTLTDGKGLPTKEFFGYYARWLGRPLRLVPGSMTRPTILSLTLLDSMRRLAGIKSETSAPAFMYMNRRGTYSIAKAQAMLNFHPCVDLEEGMQRTEQWLRQTEHP
jgi:nucleoside-diphosphate-sugar epimerase